MSWMNENLSQQQFCLSVCVCGVGSGVNVFFRKIAVAAASSPVVEITQQGDNLSIKTSTSVRTTNVSFTVGQSFSETTVDGRACTVHVSYHTSVALFDDARVGSLFLIEHIPALQ